MRRRHSPLAIVGFLLGGLLLACLISAALGLVWYALYGTISGGGTLTPTP